MSQPPQSVLLDSNAYFRLACSVHPLLQQTFGENPTYSLFILPELDDEYNTSPRLRHKFAWVTETRYRQDRTAKRYALPGHKRPEARQAFTFLDHYADEHGLNLSREDLKALAAGFVTGIPVVSDDAAMNQVAQAHDIDWWSTIKLLKVMVNNGRIGLDTVTEIFQYWDYENDLPMPKDKIRKVFKTYFGSAECPF